MGQLSSLTVHESASARGDSRRFWRRGRWVAAGWLVMLLVVLALGALLALTADARPAYDAFGWLVWGHQTLHGGLNLDGAPSWKPLTFLFTLPYSLLGHRLAMWLWVITACAGAVAGPLMAGRVAYRLAPRGEGWMPRRLPPLLAALIAAGATATMTVAAKQAPIDMGLLRQALIVTSDPLVLALWLGAVDCHLSRRHGWALGLVWLCALGRPEAWPCLAGYGLWLCVLSPRLRIWVALAILSLPVAWFLAPGLSSRSWMSAGDLDLNQPTAIHGNKITGVLERVRTLSGTVMQVEVAAAIVIVALRRHRAALGLVGLAAVWTAAEIAFALHGWSAVQRYMIEAGGLLAVVGGVGAAHALTWPAARLAGVRVPLNAFGLTAVVLFAVALIPFARDSVDGGRGVIENQKLNAAEETGLDRLMARTGGASRVLACGAPAGALGWQSALAWQLGLNVARVGYAPESHYRSQPVTFFSRQGTRWQISLLNTPTSLQARCRRLNGLSS